MKVTWMTQNSLRYLRMATFVSVILLELMTLENIGCSQILTNVHRADSCVCICLIFLDDCSLPMCTSTYHSFCNRFDKYT